MTTVWVVVEPSGRIDSVWDTEAKAVLRCGAGFLLALRYRGYPVNHLIV